MRTNKALLWWAGRTLLEYQVAQLVSSRCSEIVVVLGHDAERLSPILDALDRSIGGEPRLRVLRNPDYASGKCSSIRVGVAAASPGATAVLILGVDQPRPAWLLDRLIVEQERIARPEGEQTYQIVVPACGGRRGHPPLFAASLIPELLAISEETLGLRDVLLRHAAEILPVELDTPLVRVNLNTPEEYAAALRLAAEWDSPR